MSNPPLRAAIIPVTPLQQNCTLLWCTGTMRGAFVDPGGDLDRLKAAAAQHGVTIEKILLTHGHIDHCDLRARLLALRLRVAGGIRPAGRERGGHDELRAPPSPLAAGRADRGAP